MNSTNQFNKLSFDALFLHRKHNFAKLLCFKNHFLRGAVMERHKQIQFGPDFNCADFFPKFSKLNGA